MKKIQSNTLIDQNFLGLERELLALDKRLETIVLKNPGLPLVVSHPTVE